MAAIGIRLRRLVRRNTVIGLMQAYTYAGLAGAGPWIWSIVGILLVGLLSASSLLPNAIVSEFQVSATYLIAASLIATGPVQLALTRFTSDRLFDKHAEAILPNFSGVVLVVTIAAMAIGVMLISRFFRDQSPLYCALMLTGFIVLCNTWIATTFLSGLKQYGAILWTFFLGYSLTTVAALSLRSFGIEGLVLGFVIGQSVLLALLLLRIYHGFSARRAIAFDLFKKGYRYPSLMLIGILYNIAVWTDKMMFWYASGTGQVVIGPLHASIIYDIPVFLAYLAITPGMAVFMLRMETEFAGHYQAFNTAAREGESLEQIECARDAMVHSLRSALFDIVKIQSVTALVIFSGSAALLAGLGISKLYLPLLHVQVIATSLQMLFLAMMNSLLYLDRRRAALFLIGTFGILNGLLTAVTLISGPVFYGYGFALSMLIAVLLGLWMLDRKLELLEYEMFMLQ